MEEKFTVVVEALASITREFREFKTAMVKQQKVCTGKCCNKNEINNENASKGPPQQPDPKKSDIIRHNPESPTKFAKSDKIRQIRQKSTVKKNPSLSDKSDKIQNNPTNPTKSKII